MEEISYSYVLLAGLLSFLSPCVLPIVPGYLCFIAGTSLDKVLDDSSTVRVNIFKYALSFVLGFSTVFILLGASATILSSLLYEYIDILRIVGGIIIIIFGIHFTQIIQIPFLNNDTRFQLQNYRPGLIGSYIIGLSFAFGWTPCIGPILGSIITLSATESTISKGIILLTFYSLGLAIPFILSGYFITIFINTKKSLSKYFGLITKTGGLILLTTGVLILTNQIQVISYYILATFPFLTKLG